MTAHLPTKARLDAVRPQLIAHAKDWAERECTTFDDAVLRDEVKELGGGSIWDMPAIDSKRAVALLVELETLIGGGCKLPVSLIKSGGYVSGDDLVTKIFANLDAACDAQKPGLASAAAPPAASTARPPQVQS